MKKPYLLIMGYTYYPNSGIGDWKGRFETYEDARNAFEEVEQHFYFTKGSRKGEIKETWHSYIFEGVKYDWYEIIDLEAI